jgi:hypothetical protein
MSNGKKSPGEASKSREIKMSYHTEQATSRDWLEGNEFLSFTTRYLIEAATISISNVGGNDIYQWERLGDHFNLASEFRFWDELSDEALRQFEEEL